MERIHDYEILEKIGETTGSVIYRGRKAGYDDTVVLKILMTYLPPPSEIARFRQEYDIINRLDIDGVIKTYEIITYENRLVIVFEDFNGVSIEKILNDGNVFDVKSFLNYGIKISEAIGELHKRSIIHKGIKPGNILLNQDGVIKITDFGIALVLTHENEQIYKPGMIQESLLYMSPEQTGRMNRMVDYRTDLYSLGATFYKMITGKAPFDSKDPLEIIHSHIAKEPETPVNRISEIPKIISDIIMKLLSKNAEDRYQNAFGLMADLRECLENLDMDGNIADFELAKHDISSRLIIPQKLFGRKKEIDLLISSFKAISNQEISDKSEGNVEVMFVLGSPGIGKSALINEINKSVINQGGYFLSGKYEQFRKDTPYSGIIHSFQKLLMQILSGREDKIEEIRRDMRETLRLNGKIITDILPELELIIGKQAEVPKLGPNETKNRFNIIFERFVGVLAKKDHPIVLFLDNLQWADIASLQLVKILATSSIIRHMLIIGSYRDNEVNGSHPLLEILREIEKANIKLNRIQLSELTMKDVKDLIVNFLKCSEDRGSSLAELIFKRTNGNPFFVNEFLHTLYNEKLIETDAHLGWKWDIDKINRMPITDNVVEFLSHKIKQLPERIKEILKICACIGNRFDLETLTLVFGKSINMTLEILTEAVDEGYIGISGNLYVFNHDRIQEAAYSLVPDNEKPSLHYTVGKLMLKNTDPAELKKKLLYIVDQLNLSRSLITESKEKEELARLNYESGKKSKSSSAFLPAFKYFQTGINLLGDKCWQNQYDLALALYTEAVETAYLNGDYEEMNQYADAVIDNARNIFDRVPVYETKIHAYDAQLNFEASVDTCLDVFKKLNCPMPKYPGKLRLKTALLKIKIYLLLKGIDSLSGLPDMTDPFMLSVFRISPFLTQSSLYILPDLYIFSSVEQVRLSLIYGQCESQSLVYIRMAIILINVIGDIEAGYKLGKIGLKLIKRYNARRYEAGALGYYYLQIAIWKEHLKSVRSAVMKVYSVGMETGDLETISLCLFLHDAMGINTGSELSELEQSMAKDYKRLEQLKQLQIFGMHKLFWQVVLNLLGRSEFPSVITGTAFNKEQMLSMWESLNARTNLGSFYVYELMLNYLFNDYKKAMLDANNSVEYLGSMIGGLAIFDYYFYSSLTKLALYSEASMEDKIEYRRYVNQTLKKIKGWSMHAPMNNEHRIAIIEAEKARILGWRSVAGAGYDRAIELSRKNEYLIEEAIANELAGNYYITMGRRKLARVYIENAYTCYARWGALAKLKQMQDTHPEILSQIRNVLTAADSQGIASAETASSMIDLRTVVKASQIISGEVALKKLLAKMIKIAMENAGAQKGFMILEDNGRFLIEAEGTVGTEETMLKSTPLESYEGLSATIVNYAARTNNILILNDASVEGDFITDPYIQKNKPKSILCAPIINQGKLTGILYLENNLFTGAFTQERIEILNILSSQMAISIENAKFYKNLEGKVRERTEELSIANTQLKNEIAEREKIEEKLKTSNKELESFAYIVSHDLQEPLRKIMTFGDRLKEKNNQNHSEKSTDYIERMQNAATRMQGLIQGLLHYSRVTTKTQPFEKIDLNRIINEVISDLEVRILDTGGNVETGNLPVVYADPLQMRQLFQNLIGNSLKFKKKEESPVIKIYPMKKIYENHCRIAVEDNGIGIDKSDYDKIFGVFQRLHGRTEYEGYGVGLAICKKIVERHRGKLEVEGKIGIGTKFIISLPVA